MSCLALRMEGSRWEHVSGESKSHSGHEGDYQVLHEYTIWYNETLVQYSIVSMIWYGMVWYGMVWYGIV